MKTSHKRTKMVRIQIQSNSHAHFMGEFWRSLVKWRQLLESWAQKEPLVG